MTLKFHKDNEIYLILQFDLRKNKKQKIKVCMFLQILDALLNLRIEEVS